MASSPSPIRYREINTADLESVIDLLARGFHDTTSRGLWVRALGRLSQHVSPNGFPRYGYLLESGGKPVGVVLLIFTRTSGNEQQTVRCNVAAWYVEPSFRAYAPILALRALHRRSVTYVNATPAPNTLPILQAQGYKRYVTGAFRAVPALCLRSWVGGSSGPPLTLLPART